MEQVVQRPYESKAPQVMMVPVNDELVVYLDSIDEQLWTTPTFMLSSGSGWATIALDIS